MAAHQSALATRLTLLFRVHGHTGLQVRMAQLALRSEFNLRGWGAAMHLAASVCRVAGFHVVPSLYQIHGHAALQVPVPWLVLLVEFQSPNGCRQMATCCGGHGKAACCIQPLRGSVVAEEDLCLGRGSLPAVGLDCGSAQPAYLVATLKLRMLRMQLDDLLATTGIQLHRGIQHQQALVRVLCSPHGAAGSLGHAKIHPFGGGCQATDLMKSKPAGLHVNLARRSRLSGRCQRVTLRFGAYDLARCSLGRYGRRHAGAHHRNLHRPCGFGRSRLLVVFKLRALYSVHVAAVCAVQLDPHVVQQRVAFLQLNNFRRMDLEERVAASRLRVGDSIGFLLNLNAQALGNIAPVEGVPPLADHKKRHQSHHQQESRGQHQRPHPFNGQAHGQFPIPSRAASRWARLSPSSLHNRRAVAPEPFSTPAVNATNWRTFSSTWRAATESSSRSSSRNGVSVPKSTLMCPSCSYVPSSKRGPNPVTRTSLGARTQRASSPDSASSSHKLHPIWNS